MKKAILLLLAVQWSWGTQAQYLRMHADTNSAVHIKPAAFRPQPQPLQPVPPDAYTRSFGFFCRQELRMYQAHVPVSFRLGSMEQCDMLEGKNR